MSVSDKELMNCISNTFWEQEYDKECREREHDFIKREAEKVGATVEYKMVQDMSETELMVKQALLRQGEEYNEIV